eukprot:911293-Amphidinium_carterae.1
MRVGGGPPPKTRGSALGSIFPIAPVEVPSSVVRKKLSRGCMQRLGRRRKAEGDVAKAVSSLNFLAGVEQKNSFGGYESPDIVHMIRERVATMGRPESGFEEEALTALLRCGAGYDDVAVPTST